MQGGRASVLTLDIMRQMWPYGDTKISGLIEAIAAAAPSVFPKYAHGIEPDRKLGPQTTAAIEQALAAA